MLFGNAIGTIILIILFTNIGVNAIKCYQCRSDMHKNCEGTVSNDYLLECPEKNEEDEDTSDKPTNGTDDKPEKPEIPEIPDKPDSTNPKPTIPNPTDPESIKLDFNEIKNKSEEASSENNTEVKETQQIHCRKITQSLKVRKSSETTIIRECSFSYIGEDCQTINTKLVSLEVCDCKRESCNGVNGLIAPLWTMLLVSIALIVCYY